MKAYEPEGKKTHVTFQVQRIKPMRKEAYYKFPIKLWKKLDKRSKRFSDGTKVNVNQITNIDDLARVIFLKYGYGIYNVCFYNRWNINKKFNYKHRCRFKRCQFHPEFKGNEKHNPSKTKCKRYKVYKVGQACRLNPRYRPTQCKKIQLSIFPDTSKKGFKVSASDSTMYTFWFWKGK